jgi:asparagine synthase (glutamine-hydrolysing)
MERLRLLNEISSYDVLRSDKSIAGNGLEARTPYLDPEFIRAYFSASADVYSNERMPLVEKELIREALKTHKFQYLPLEVVNRRKEAFSDGVSGESKSWKDEIEERIVSHGIMKQDAIKTHIKRSDGKMTAEQAYYKDLFSQKLLRPYKLKFEDLNSELYERLETRWMPRFVNATDPSARTLDMY